MNRLRILMIGAALVAGSSMIASAEPRDEHRGSAYTEHDRDDRYSARYYGDRDDYRRYDRDDRGRYDNDRDDRFRHERDERNERWQNRFRDRDHDGDRR
ncbi:MAG TPA: hypothetical protein VE783_09250 [Candidatus Limnocylindrales bacterium]|nr:hypothetical protein [Candidatus Limnocylindrales bacterium]